MTLEDFGKGIRSIQLGIASIILMVGLAGIGDYFVDQYRTHQKLMKENLTYQSEYLKNQLKEEEKTRKVLNKAFDGWGKYFIR